MEGRLKATPTAILYNRKRGGRFKARLVVLGDRWDPGGYQELYSPTVSQVGSRLVLIEAARRGWDIIPYDVGNASIRASIDRTVLISLPKQWRDGQEDHGARSLPRALYGLPMSPRLWQKQYAKDLQEMGFEDSRLNPGIWTMRDSSGELIAMLSVYVDDCILAAKDKELTTDLVDKLHALHPLSKIKMDEVTDKDGTWLHFDTLGADVFYNAQKKSARITVETYLKKMLKTFGMENCSSLPAPAFDEALLYQDSPQIEFNTRQVTGSLQWADTVARPDLAQVTNCLARAANRPPTKAIAAACKRVLRYVKGSLGEGLVYSPQQEQEFQNLFRDLYRHPESIQINEMTEQEKKFEPKSFHPIQSFGDASFASTLEFKSVSGVVVYYYGCPVVWKSTAQTVRSGSTCESETVAQSDLLKVSEDIHAIRRFLRGVPETGEGDKDLCTVIVIVL
ncbi:unnamed protein product [Amoebophrya sp. A25]|nr:unnamed protein product [Amoebophrya sp. A25]|eukprot:GSA25T00017445001.1